MPTKNLSKEIITAAIEGFESQKSRIDVQIAELSQLLNDGRKQPAAAGSEAPKRKRRKMSAAGRKAIAEAQRKRWANSKNPSTPSKAAAPKAKRKLSAAGRRAISEASKRRWAQARAANA